MKSKEEVIRYINNCEKCFATVLNSNHKPEAQFVKYKQVFEDVIILGISNDNMKYFNNVGNENISVVMWSNI